jgi:hypothetical protein
MRSTRSIRRIASDATLRSVRGPKYSPKYVVSSSRTLSVVQGLRATPWMVMHIRMTMSLANGPFEPSEYFPVRFQSRTCGLREGLRFIVLVFLVRHANDARVRRADCSDWGNCGHDSQRRRIDVNDHHGRRRRIDANNRDRRLRTPTSTATVAVPG